MKNKKRFFGAIAVFSFIFLFIAVPVIFAADYVTGGPTKLSDFQTIIENIVVMVQLSVLALGVGMLAWAGFTWMTAGGDETKLKLARGRLIYGLIGLAIAIFAGSAKDFIATFWSGMGK